jgi:hypothetical protein
VARNLQSASSILGDYGRKAFASPPPSIVAPIRQVKANKERSWLVTAWFLRSKRGRSNTEWPPANASGTEAKFRENCIRQYQTLRLITNASIVPLSVGPNTTLSLQEGDQRCTCLSDIRLGSSLKLRYLLRDGTACASRGGFSRHDRIEAFWPTMVYRNSPTG